MIVGMLRVKDEARWIERVLRAMLTVCERVFVLDDHSTDGTAYLCASIPGVALFNSPFAGLDETRDKNWLLAKVAECAPSWILHIDGDEELAPGSAEIIHALAKPAGPDAYRFQVLYLWDRPDQIRVDRWYKNFRRPSLFRFRPGARFESPNGGGFHCGNVPGRVSVGECEVKLLHYGYMHREDRVRKYVWYNAPDKQPIPAAEDGYRHMVVGDLFPADSVFMHAGPLALEALSCAATAI